jgi:hypothetical protein
MRPITFSMLLAAILISALMGCKSGVKASSEDSADVNVDLSNRAPIGYEICANRNVQLPRANIDLKLLMPEKVEIPPDAQQYGAKDVEFRPGRHPVDLYRTLDSPRLMHTAGQLAIEDGKPTIHFKLEASQLPAGKYVLGVGGDPFFAYCTLTLQ